MRKLAAFVIAPFAPVLVVAIILAAQGEAREIPTAFLIGLCVGYPVALIFGVPLDVLFFSKKEYRGWPTLVIVTGVITAFLVTLLIVLDALLGPFGPQLAFSRGFWVYALLFEIAFVFSGWCFLKIAYPSLPRA